MNDLSHNSSRAAGEDFSIQQFLRVLRSHLGLILLGTALGIGAGIAAASLLPKQYEASILVEPNSDSGAAGKLGSIGSTLSQLGGLASMAGISVGGDSARAESIATLQSGLLTGRYISEHDLLPILFSSKWNAASNSWKTSDPAKMPTVWKGNEYFTKHVRKVTENLKTGLVEMTIRSRDPTLAAKWANDLVALTNDSLRSKALVESERNIGYLREQAKNTTQIELQQAVYSLMEAEIKKAMIARGRDEYALRVIDPAVAPEKPVFPQPPVFVAVGAVLGFIAAALLAIVLGAGEHDGGNQTKRSVG